MNDTVWERLGSPVMTGSQLADKGGRALRRIAECGIKVPANNRLERATKMVGWEKGQEFPGQEAIQEAARTVLDFYLITHAQAECLPAVAVRKLVYAINGGDGVVTKGERAV